MPYLFLHIVLLCVPRERCTDINSPQITAMVDQRSDSVRGRAFSLLKRSICKGLLIVTGVIQRCLFWAWLATEEGRICGILCIIWIQLPQGVSSPQQLLPQGVLLPYSCSHRESPLPSSCSHRESPLPSSCSHRGSSLLFSSLLLFIAWGGVFKIL